MFDAALAGQYLEKKKCMNFIQTNMEEKYPRLAQLGVHVYAKGGCDAVDPLELQFFILSLLPAGSLKEFDGLFGVQTCPVLAELGQALYAWDVEAVLERMMSGRITGTQLFWD